MIFPECRARGPLPATVATSQRLHGKHLLGDPDNAATDVGCAPLGGLPRIATGRMLHRMAAVGSDPSFRSVARVRLGAVLGINQTLSWGTTFYLPAIIAEPVAASLGQSLFRVLGAFSWSLLVAGICAPRVGRWIDQHGGRGALLASILVIALGQAMLAISANMALWYLAWTVIGVGMAMGLYDAAFATLGGLLGQEAGPTITGVTLVAGFASSIFWTLGAVLLGAFGWRGLLLSYAGLMLLANLPMVWLLVPPSPARPHERGLTAFSGSSAARRVAILLGAFFALRWFITSAIAVHVLPLLQGVGLTSREAVGIAALIGPGQVAGRILEWTIGPRINILVKARLGALLLPLGVAILALGGALEHFRCRHQLRAALRHEQRHHDDQSRHTAAGAVRA